MATTQRAAPALTFIVRRLAWLAAFLAVMGVAILEIGRHDLGWLPIVAFLIFPDLAMLAGIGQPHQKRQLPARAVPFYNTLHQPLLPLAFLAIVVAIGAAPFWFFGAFAWMAHIAIDRAVGYGLRTPDGWQRG